MAQLDRGRVIDLDGVVGFSEQTSDLASIGAGLEEVREHIAAAFDGVRELTEQVTGLRTEMNAVHRRLERVGKVGPALTDLVAWMTSVGERLDGIEAELVRMTQEQRKSLRRAPLQARPPAISDEQVDAIVARVLAGLGIRAPEPVAPVEAATAAAPEGPEAVGEPEAVGDATTAAGPSPVKAAAVVETEWAVRSEQAEAPPAKRRRLRRNR